MGSVIGKTLSAENGLSPAYDLLGKSGGYELRTYLSYVVAEVQASNEPGKEDDCFRTLAKYIGVFGDPANKIAGGESGEQISMTAPVVTGPPSLETGAKISMTAPVVTQTSGAPGSDAKIMQFIMPQKFKSISDLPTPTDSRVTLREVPELSYLVWQFTGNMGKDVNAAAESVRLLAEEAVKKDNGGAFAEYVGPDAKFLVARYNPPWTVPFLKTNELWFPLPLSREEIEAKLPSA